MTLLLHINYLKTKFQLILCGYSGVLIGLQLKMHTVYCYTVLSYTYTVVLAGDVVRFLRLPWFRAQRVHAGNAMITIARRRMKQFDN